MHWFWYAATLGFIIGTAFSPRFRNTAFAVIAISGAYGYSYYRQLAYTESEAKNGGGTAGAGGRSGGAVLSTAAADDIASGKRSPTARARATAAHTRTAAAKRNAYGVVGSGGGLNKVRALMGNESDERERPDFIEREGYLTRRGRNFPFTWEKRYYQIQTPNSGAVDSTIRIAYFEDAFKTKLLGEFECWPHGMIVDSNERDHAFQVITPSRKLMVTASDASDKREWMRVLNHNLRLLDEVQRRAAAKYAAAAKPPSPQFKPVHTIQEVPVSAAAAYHSGGGGGVGGSSPPMKHAPPPRDPNNLYDL